MLNLHPDWKKILKHSYTAWAAYALMLLNAFEASYYYFLGYAPIPQWTVGAISAGLGMLIPYLRVLLQPKISGEQPDANP